MSKRFWNWNEELIEALQDEDCYVEPKVSMGVTYSPYTDEYPYEIVEVVNDKRIKVRALRCEKVDGEWAFYSDETKKVIALKKLKYRWKRNSKDVGHWSIGIARKYLDPHF